MSEPAWEIGLGPYLRKFNSGDQHAVELPHPKRTGPKTTGTCTCGWTVTYGWGGHRDAAITAGEHIETEGHAQPVDIQRMDGQITVMEGLSL